MRVILLIRSLEIGGAERQFVQLAIGMHESGADVRAMVFYAGGTLQRELEAAGVPVIDLAKRGRWDIVAFFWRLARHAREVRPDVIYSFMASANILAVLVRPLIPHAKVIWGVRASNMDWSKYDWLSRAESFVQRMLSRLPKFIIANSHAGKNLCVLMGFPESRITVVPNGIDTHRFRFDGAARRLVRENWGVHADEILFGIAARIDPMKGHITFLEAAAQLSQTLPSSRFVCVGTGDNSLLSELKRLAKSLEIEDRVIWAGVRQDMPAVYSAWDMASSTSYYGEGFSNSIGEAMSCGLTAVVTDVGDSAEIVGPVGIVVKAGDASAIAAAWRTFSALTCEERAQRSAEARSRITELFSVRAMVDKTLVILNS